MRLKIKITTTTTTTTTIIIIIMIIGFYGALKEILNALTVVN